MPPTPFGIQCEQCENWAPTLPHPNGHGFYAPEGEGSLLLSPGYAGWTPTDAGGWVCPDHGPYEYRAERFVWEDRSLETLDQVIQRFQTDGWSLYLQAPLSVSETMLTFRRAR
jgi:hypothetical protein